MNTPKDKLKGMIGFARKAGKIIRGTDIVNEAVRQGAPKLYAVVVASDISENTRKRIVNCMTYYGQSFMDSVLTTDELSKAIGSHGAVACVGVTDEGFAAQIIKNYEAVIAEDAKEKDDRASDGISPVV